MRDPAANLPILVVDDEADFAKGLARLVQKAFPGHPALIRPSGAEALALLAERPCALLITDLRMPEMDGFALMQQALCLDPTLSVVVLTGFGSIETAVAALKNGAYDFLTKPIDQDGLYRVVAKGLQRSALLRENVRLREAVAVCGPGLSIIGESPAMQRLRDQIEAVAATDYSVLILGESGSGKELVARTIHRRSRRGGKQMVAINCTAIPESVLESELFGHVKGAFTGADKQALGLFMAADGSSLLLDEIGDMPLHLQPKILRALQEREIRPVGGSESVPVDARILASTNQRLEVKIAKGGFRDDLYYRLNVLCVHVPPLRDRGRDAALLATYFLNETSRELEAGDKELRDDALDYLCARPWPGNVRELINFVRRLAVFCRGPVITGPQVRLLDTNSPGAASAPADLESYKTAKSRYLDDFTRAYMERLLSDTGGNISQAARISGLERVSIQKIVKRLNIDVPAFRFGEGKE
jgi:DNA-binding NtrC family response regulator